MVLFLMGTYLLTTAVFTMIVELKLLFQKYIQIKFDKFLCLKKLKIF